MFSFRMVIAAPFVLPVAILRMKPGMSMPVGQASMQGASWQKKQRLLSISARLPSSGGSTSPKLAS